VRQVLFVAYDETRSFEEVSERLIEQHLADYIPKRVYLGEYADVEVVTRDIVQAIDAGAVVTNYTGHGRLKSLPLAIMVSPEII